MVEDQTVEYEITLSAKAQQQLALDQVRIDENRKLIETLTDKIKTLESQDSAPSKSPIPPKEPESNEIQIDANRNLIDILTEQIKNLSEKIEKNQIHWNRAKGTRIRKGKTS